MKSYAIILKFDKKSENRIQKLINHINEKLGSKYEIPPHITLSVFETEDLSICSSVFDEHLNELITGEVTFESVGQFMPKVLFLAPLMNQMLLHNHDVISRIIRIAKITDDKLIDNQFYLKNKWQPHCTLAVDLDKNTIIHAIDIIAKKFKPITAKVTSVLLVQADPYIESSEHTNVIRNKRLPLKLSPYAVKVISKIIVEGKPVFKDKNYSDDTNFFEEQVLLIYANSFDDAFVKAGKYMDSEVNYPAYQNIYGQTVRVEVLDYVNCYKLFEDPSKEEPEVFSEIYSVPKSISDEDFLISRYDYYINEEDQMKRDQWETLKRKVILNAEFPKYK